VRGKVVDAATGELGSPDTVSLIRQGGGTPVLSARSTSVRAGEFSFDEVLPGTYLLETKPTAGPGDRPPLVGCQMISLGSGDLDRVVVEMKPVIELRGKILVEGAPVSSWPQITLTPTDGLNYLDFAMVDAEGRFAISGLEPMHYLVRVGSLPPPIFVKSVRFNGLDAKGELDLASVLTAFLEIVIGYGTSSITGMVSDSEGPVGPAINVIATRRDQPPYRTQTDQSGRYSLEGLPPGEYSLTAMDIGPVPPESIEKLGKAITVGEGVATTVDLQLTSIDDVRAAALH
jgi:hypothetical protein